MEIIDDLTIKKIQLDILNEVHNFCKARKINYSLSGGTLIGAIRHKGYIPWDDDIDIMMPRPSYNKFINEFNNYNPNKYFVYSLETSLKYNYPYAKIADITTLIVENVSNSSIGINIDLFPIDGLPYSQTDSKRHVSYLKFYRKLFLWKLIYKRKISKWYDKIFFYITHVLLFFITKKNISQKISQIAQKYTFNNSEFVGCTVWGYGNKERCHKEVYNDYLLVDFENHKFSSLIGYEEYLKNLYGNYMELPPENQRNSPHDYIKAFKY